LQKVVFAYSCAIESCQVSGTDTVWRKNAVWFVLPFWVVLPKKCRHEQNMVTESLTKKNKQKWFSDSPEM
jgi:hypothetical protein